MEDGLSSDIASGVETVLVTPGDPWCVLWHYGLCLFDIAALCSSLIVAKDNGYCICSHKEKLFLQAPEASVSPPSLTRLVTPVTAGERGQDQS